MPENILLLLTNCHSSSRFMMIYLLKMLKKNQKMDAMFMVCKKDQYIQELHIPSIDDERYLLHEYFTVLAV